MLPKDLANLIVTYIKHKSLMFLDDIIKNINLLYKNIYKYNKADSNDDLGIITNTLNMVGEVMHDNGIYYPQIINIVNNPLQINDNYFINLITNYLQSIIFLENVGTPLDFDFEVAVLNKLFNKYDWPYRLILEGDIKTFNWFKGHKVQIN